MDKLKYLICIWYGSEWIGKVLAHTGTTCHIEWLEMDGKPIHIMRAFYEITDSSQINEDFIFMTEREYEAWKILNS